MEEIQNGLIVIHGLRLKAVHKAPEIAFPVCVGFCEAAAQEAVAKRAVGHESHAELTAQAENAFFRFTPDHTVLVLDGRDGADSVRAQEIVLRSVGKAPFGDFSFFFQIRHDAGNNFRLHMRIHAVLIEEVNVIGSETPERSFNLRANRFGTAVGQVDGLPVFHLLSRNAKLRAADSPIPPVRKGFAQKLLVGRAVDRRRVKEGASEIQSLVQKGNHFGAGGGLPIGMIHAHAAKPDFGSCDPAYSAGFHDRTLLRRGVPSHRLPA